jgi:hypothetical protein
MTNYSVLHSKLLDGLGQMHSTGIETTNVHGDLFLLITKTM